MSDYGKLLSGSIRRSKKKWQFDKAAKKWIRVPGSNDKAPDLWGNFSLAVPGADRPLKVQLSFWMRRGDDGSAYLSGSGEWDRNEQGRIQIDPSTFTPSGASSGDGGEAASNEDLPF